MHWMYKPTRGQNGLELRTQGGVSKFNRRTHICKTRRSLHSGWPHRRSRDHRSNASTETIRPVRASRFARGLLFVLVLSIGFASGAAFHSFAFSAPSHEGLVADRASDSTFRLGNAGESTYASSTLIDPPDEHRVVVKPGDTLWKLAKQYAPEQADLRSFIENVIEHNQLSSSELQSGQVIHIPASFSGMSDINEG